MRNYPYNQEFYKKTGYKVTEEVISRYDEFGVDVSELLEEDYYLAFKNMPGIIPRLEKHVADYPNIPSFKNYLYIAYSQNGKKLKAQRLLEETIALHPEYVFAYLNKANLYIEQKKPKEALKLLGPNLQISDLVKDGEVYHFSEFLVYQGTVCRTQLALDMDLEIVEERHKTMFWLDPDHNETRRAGLEIVMARMERGIGNMHKKMGEMIEVESFPTVAFPQGNIRTPLHHAELEAFYKFGEEDLPKKIIEKILQLPRATLIEDLEKILEDGIKRFYHFRNNNEEFDESGQSFMIHALYFLGAIEAEESLQVVLNLMRQGKEFLDYWFADSLHDYFYSTLFALGKNQLEALKNYVLEDNQFYVTRLTAVSVVTQVALHFPERKEEVKKWFQEVYEYLLAHRKNKNLIDTHFIGWSVTELAQLRAVDMFPIVETLFHKGWVPEIIDGDLEEIKKGFLLEPEPADLFPFPKDIYEYYSGENQNRALERTVDTELLKGFDPAYNDYLMNLFLGPSEAFFERDDEEDDDDWEFPPYEPIEPIKRVGPKVGRNDPCPCGSGKKYKKCCLNK